MMERSASQPPAVPSSGTRAHLDWIDGMRAITALYVLLHHMAGYLYCPPLHPAWWWKLVTPLLFGRAAVAVFIVISGFCLMIPVARRQGEMRGGLWGFAARRIKRILPPYYAAMAFAIAVTLAAGLTEPTHNAWKLTLPFTTRNTVISALLMQDFIGNLYAVNYVFWSIAVEWHLYFVFPILVMIYRKTSPGLLAVIGCGIVVLIAVTKLAPVLHLPLYWHYLALFTCGAAGAGFVFDGRYARFRPHVRRVGPWLAALTAAMALLCFYTGLGKGIAPDLFLGISCSALMATLALRPEVSLVRLLSVRPLIWVGAFSYSLYLTHAIVLQWVWVKIVAPMGLSGAAPLLTEAAICFPATLVLAYGFHRLFERPFMAAQGLPSTIAQPAQPSAT